VTPISEGLSIDGVTVAFGGLIAVDGASLTAPRQRITGLIGPNGAGKTTLFNACTGLVRPRSGDVRLDGTPLGPLSPSRRARLGLGRTFQRMELFDDLSVTANVSLGREAGLAGASVLGQLVARRRESEEVATATAEAIELCGLTTIGDRPAGALSTGQRRLVELARALAGPFTILMLDEPSSGLDARETALFGDILERVVAARDLGILLVEHDMTLVMRVCAYIHVLDFGQMIFEGLPEDAQRSDVVRAAYLGSEAA